MTPIETAHKWLFDNKVNADEITSTITLPTSGVILTAQWWVLVVPCDNQPYFITMD